MFDTVLLSLLTLSLTTTTPDDGCSSLCTIFCGDYSEEKDFVDGMCGDCCLGKWTAACVGAQQSITFNGAYRLELSRADQ